ncbi:MAG: 4-hydroxythreonine-4-phosphate dehydrogenase PdxA [Ignavibacteria bacterium CG2_30_36_16]|nr:4-hydroxythreonine-4-phosphate dehydrogenase PdxA [Ignavibacteria bacterium]OIP62672.1 MAG: 4-hydroxythreonine-4-phosphate dehydrogenase PdxA [Ignavibacteria bacterium CG2_30_36_16]
MAAFIFTCGDVNGIGPEITYKVLQKFSVRSNDEFIFIVPLRVLNKLSKQFGELDYQLLRNPDDKRKKKVSIIDLGNYPAKPGAPSKESGEISFSAIETSFAFLKKGYADAVITAPISKTAINLAGISFRGHTEMFAGWCGVKSYVMTFLSSKMNVALQTIHISLKEVSKSITEKSITQTLNVLNKMLQVDLRIDSPTIAVLGVNPHAGEEGVIGSEEENIIKPAIEEIKNKFYVAGPFPPDAFFANRMEKKFDLVLGMYHDQILIPFKLLNFNSGVNFTAGLPIVRTSPDHGTAFDIAWKGIADESSMIQAYKYAKKIVQNRNIK